MWRKSEEAKPSSRAAEKPETAGESPTSAPSASSSMSNPMAAGSQVVESSAPAPTLQQEATLMALTPPADSSPSQISAGLKIRGEITGTSDLLIDGDIQGKILLTGCKLTVGPSGRVKSDIEARDISVFGMVSGNLKAAESVALGNTGRVEGSVIAKRISIDDGARLRGKVEMIRAEASPTPAAKAAAAVSSASGNVSVPTAAAAQPAKEKPNS
jgi:cytoskeletal protein CcmA (bactofilin family)